MIMNHTYLDFRLLGANKRNLMHRPQSLQTSDLFFLNMQMTENKAFVAALIQICLWKQMRQKPAIKSWISKAGTANPSQTQNL